MGSRSATELLLLPVQLHGIRLGRPVDLLFDPQAWRVLGFVVLCGDESRRFLPFAASLVADEAITVGSALMLLDDAEFYEKRGVSFRSILGSELGGGIVRDVLLDGAGRVTELEVERDGVRGPAPVPSRAAA